MLQITQNSGMLQHLYSSFEKSYIAGMCKELAKGMSVFFTLGYRKCAFKL
jgi:hypothetical protein